MTSGAPAHRSRRVMLLACTLMVGSAEAAQGAPGLASARVEFVQGAAVGIPPPPPPARSRAKKNRTAAVTNSPAVPLAAGDALSEGTRITVPKDGYLRLRLADGSVIQVQAESDVELQRLRKRSAGPYESVIKLRRGKLESKVAPQPRGRVFEIRAPGVVASVRGTRFDVAVSPEGRVSTAVTEGVVKLQPERRTKHAPPSAELKAGEGAVIEAGGRLDKRTTLPPPPDLSTLPATLQDAQLLVLHLAAPAANVARYEVRIARDPAMHAVLRNASFESGRLHFPVLDDGDYVIGVRAVDRDGLAGTEARRALRVHTRPVPPLYQSPAAGARLLGESGQLLCADVADADGVQLQVAAAPDFALVALDARPTDGCRIGLASLVPGDYWWRVASWARDAQGVSRRGPFAEPQPFTIVPAPTVHDVALDDSDEQPTLRWQAEAGQTFRVQLAQDIDFAAPLRDLELHTPSWTVSAPSRGHYYVRLQARDASGLIGPFSPARRVRIGPVVRTMGGVLSLGDGGPVDRP